MKEPKHITSSVLVFGAMLCLSGCCTSPPAPAVTLQPKATNVPRGATSVDLYGRWVPNTVAVLGRNNLNVTYEVQWARAGSVITVNANTGVVVSGVLNPLDGATNMFTTVNNRVTLTPTPANVGTDASGRSRIQMSPRAGASNGPETLQVDVYYPASAATPAFRDSDPFEIDRQGTMSYD